MVIALFRSRLRSEHAAEFHALAAEMLELARGMPGFISYKSYSAPDGERCSVIEFDSHEHLRAWREHPAHREAQHIGRQRFYEAYTLHVSEPGRAARFER